MKLSKIKIQRGILGLLAMAMVLSTSSAITVYAGQVISGDGTEDTTETSSDPEYNGTEGDKNEATGSGFTFNVDNPAQQGLRVTFLINTKTKKI